MNDEHITPMVSNWKHWLIYTTLTFLSIFVFAEFALSASLYSLVAPSNFMFYFTPIGLFFGESMVSLFASALLFVGLFLILRLSVYVKKENSLKFNRSDAYKLLPFYLTAIISLAIYISIIPLELSNIVTYIVFILLFESFVEHSQVSGYGQWMSEIIKKSAVEEITEVDEKTQELISLTEEVPEKDKMDEMDIPTIEKRAEDIVKETVVIKKRVKKVKKPVEEDYIECPICGFIEQAETNKCSACGEPFEGIDKDKDELLDTFEKHEGKFDRELLLADEKHIEVDIEKELDDELIQLEEELEECSICGSRIPEGAESCPICGYLISEIDEAPMDLPEELRMELKLEDLKEEERGISEEIVSIQCPLCLADIAYDAVECPECGEPLIEKELDEELIQLEEELEEECSICGSKLPEGAESCPICDQLIYGFDEETDISDEIVSIQCPLCLADIVDDVAECPECGEPLIEEEEEEKDDFFKDIE